MQSAPWPEPTQLPKLGWRSLVLVAAVALAGGFGIATLLHRSNDTQPQAPVSSISSTTKPGQSPVTTTPGQIPKPSTTRAPTGHDGNDVGDD